MGKTNFDVIVEHLAGTGNPAEFQQLLIRCRNGTLGFSDDDFDEKPEKVSSSVKKTTGGKS